MSLIIPETEMLAHFCTYMRRTSWLPLQRISRFDTEHGEAVFKNDEVQRMWMAFKHCHVAVNGGAVALAEDYTQYNLVLTLIACREDEAVIQEATAYFKTGHFSDSNAYLKAINHAADMAKMQKRISEAIAQGGCRVLTTKIIPN